MWLFIVFSRDVGCIIGCWMEPGPGWPVVWPWCQTVITGVLLRRSTHTSLQAKLVNYFCTLQPLPIKREKPRALVICTALIFPPPSPQPTFSTNNSISSTQISCQLGRMSVKYHVSQISYQSGIMSVTYHVSQVSCQWSIMSVRHHVNQASCQSVIKSGSISVRYHVSQVSCQSDIMSVRYHVSQVSCQWSIMSVIFHVSQVSCQSGIMSIRYQVR